jgi:hypothetical protein
MEIFVFNWNVDFIFRFTREMYAIIAFSEIIILPQRRILDLTVIPKMIRSSLYSRLGGFTGLRTLILGITMFGKRKYKQTVGNCFILMNLSVSTDKFCYNKADLSDLTIICYFSMSNCSNKKVLKWWLLVHTFKKVS